MSKEFIEELFFNQIKNLTTKTATQRFEQQFSEGFSHVQTARPRAQRMFL